MLLASVSEIRDALGFDDMTDINAAITDALNAAEHMLASALNTSFELTEVTDVFYVDAPTVIQGSHRRTEFWLSRGFLRAAATVTGFAGTQGDLRYDLEKGIVKDITTDYSDTTLTFVYSAGFPRIVDDADADPVTYTDRYDLAFVPKWLQEAAKLQTFISLADAAPITEAGIKIDVTALQTQLQTLMNTRIRYAPMALYPL